MTPTKRAVGLVALGIVVTSVLYGWLLWKVYPTLGGDEPHYVLAARSMVEDGDVDLRNDYHDVTRWGPIYPGHPRLEVDVSAFDYRGDGTLRPVHNVGLPVLLMPSQVVKPGFRSAQVTMVGVAVLTMAALFALLLRLARRWWVAVLVWLPVALTLPVLAFSNQVYPEMPAALVILAVVHLLLWRRGLLVAGLLTSMLPWLHVRYWLLVPVLLGFILWRASSWRSRVLAAAPTLVTAVVMAVFFQRWYGGWLPSAPYDVAAYHGAEKTDLVAFYRLGLGSMWSPVYGLIPYSPVFWLGLVGVGAVIARWGRAGLAAAGGVLFYVLAVAIAGGAAFSLPARFLIPIVPLLAVPVLAFVELGVGALAAFGVLAVANALVALPVSTRFGDLYNLDVARYPPVVKVERLYPVFMTDIGLVRFDYGIEPFQPRTAGVVGLILGLRPGPWEIRFASTGTTRVELYDLTDGRLRAAADVPVGGVFRYESRSSRPLDVRVHDPEVQGATGELLGWKPHEPNLYPQWPKALAWVVVTAAGAYGSWRFGCRRRAEPSGWS